MTVWEYGIIGISSALSGLFTLRHARLRIETEASFSKAREALYVAVNVALWFLLLCFVPFGWEYLFACLTTVALVGLSAVDFEIFEIPVEFNWFLLLLGLAHLVLVRQDWLVYVIGFFAVSTIFLIVSLVTKGKGMGGGDIKLMATLGLLLGWQKIFLVMLFGSVLGIVFHGLVMLVRRKEHMLAFGPYLSLAAYIVMCIGEEALAWYIGTFIKAV